MFTYNYLKDVTSLWSPRHGVARTCNTWSCSILTLVQGTKPVAFEGFYVFWTFVCPCLTLILVQDIRPGGNKPYMFSYSCFRLSSLFAWKDVIQNTHRASVLAGISKWWPRSHALPVGRLGLAYKRTKELKFALQHEWVKPWEYTYFNPF